MLLITINYYCSFSYTTCLTSRFISSVASTLYLSSSAASTNQYFKMHEPHESYLLNLLTLNILRTTQETDTKILGKQVGSSFFPRPTNEPEAKKIQQARRPREWMLWPQRQTRIITNNTSLHVHFHQPSSNQRHGLLSFKCTYNNDENLPHIIDKLARKIKYPRCGQETTTKRDGDIGWCARIFACTQPNL